MIINGKIVKSNILSLQSEINRLRTKHGLATLSFPAIGERPMAANYNDLKTKVSTLVDSQWIDTVNVSGIGTYNVNDLIRFTDIKVVENVINALDTICAHNPCADYANNSHDSSDRSDYSHNSDRGHRQNNSVNSINSNNSNRGQCCIVND